MIAPYRSTPIFDEATIPAGLRRDHSTKAGVWGLIRILEGRLRVDYESGASRILSEGETGLIQPEEKHRVEPLGRVRMQVDFYDRLPQP